MYVAAVAHCLEGSKMDCPFSQNRPLGGSCSRNCAFYRVSTDKTPCLFARALEIYVESNEKARCVSKECACFKRGGDL